MFNNKKLSGFVEDVETQWYKLVDNFFSMPHLNELKGKLKSNSGYPKLDVFTTENSYCLQASVPGAKPEDISVEIFTENEIHYVKISGSMSEEYKDDNAVFRTRELKRGTFVRTVALPDDIEGDPEAKIKDGIISLTWKTQKPDKPPVKKIALKQG